MANKKISELTELTTPADTDLYAVVDDSESSGEQTKKITHSNLQSAILSHDSALLIYVSGANRVQFTDTGVVPITDDSINLGSASYQFKRGYFDDGITVNGVNQGLDVTAAIHRKILNIGGWNMDASSALSVAHGLTLSKIRAVSVMITNDEGTAHYPISYRISSSDYTPSGAVYLTDSNVVIQRTSVGIFDSTDFDYPSGNRGWVIIDYVS